MKMTLHPDLIEATRLTRAGRLAEATALLQRLNQRGNMPDDRTEEARTIRQSVPLSSNGFIDVTPDTIKVPARRRSSLDGIVEAGLAETRASARPSLADRVRGLIEQVARTRVISPTDRPSSSPEPGTTPDPAAPEGRFLSATYSGEAGTRDYKLYIPSTYRGKPLPLIILLHGCTQSADDFAAGTRMNAVAEERGCFVAYPVQPQSANGQKCWNWFQPRDQKRDSGEPALIAGITRQIAREYAVDPHRIYVGGLSAGGAAAAIMGATYPDLYAAVGVHSGLACGAASDLASAFRVMQHGKTTAPSAKAPRSVGFHGRDRMVPTIVFHGEKDATVHPRNGDHVIEQSRATGAGDLRSVTQRGHVPGGHTYSRTSQFDKSGRAMLELWVVHGAGHAWSGGCPSGSYTDPRGPDASREMVRFFLDHRHPHPSRIAPVSPMADR